MRKLFQIFKERAENLDFAVVSTAVIISAALNFLFTIIARRYIPPYEYGIYSTCLLLQTYCSYAQLGVLNAYNRDYPQLLGAGKREKAKDLKNTVFTFVLCAYSLLTIIIGTFLMLIYLRGNFERKYFIGYMLSIVLLIGNTLSDFGMNTMQMNGNYNYTALVTVIKSVAGMAAGFAAIRIWGYYGLYVMPATAGFIAISMYQNRSLRGLRFCIDREILKGALLTGFPLMINALVWTAVASVDKFVILGFMDTETLGLYSVAQMGFTAVVLIPQSMSQVFYIKVSRLYGKTSDKNILVKTCNNYTLVNSLCTSIVCVIGFYILPVFVNIVMPNYKSGIAAAQIMLLGITIYGSTLLYGNIFSILKQNKELLWSSVVLCIFNIVFSVGLVIIFGKNIENVALGTATSYAAFSVLLIHKISRKSSEKKISLLKNSWGIIFIIVFPTVSLYFLISNLYASIVLSFIYMTVVSVVVIKWIKKKRLIAL